MVDDAARRRRPRASELEQGPRRATPRASTPTSRAARERPAREPSEYALLGKPLEDWKVTDSVVAARAAQRLLRSRRRRRPQGRRGRVPLREALRAPRQGRRRLRGLPASRRPRGADGGHQALPVRRSRAPRKAARRDAGRRQRQPDERLTGSGSAAGAGARAGVDLRAGLRLRKPRVQRDGGRRRARRRRASAAGRRPAGRLLRARDPRRDGPARAGHRGARRGRSRCRLPDRRAAAAIRVERDDGAGRQHRRLRRAPVRRRLDATTSTTGKCVAVQRAGAAARLGTRPGRRARRAAAQRPTTRHPHRALGPRPGDRPRDGRRAAGRLRAGARPRTCNEIPAALGLDQLASEPDHRPAGVPAHDRAGQRLLQLVLRGRKAHRLRAVGPLSAPGEGHRPGPADLGDRARSTGAASSPQAARRKAIDPQARLPRLLEPEAGAGLALVGRATGSTARCIARSAGAARAAAASRAGKVGARAARGDHGRRRDGGPARPGGPAVAAARDRAQAAAPTIAPAVDRPAPLGGDAAPTAATPTATAPTTTRRPSR